MVDELCELPIENIEIKFGISLNYTYLMKLEALILPALYLYHSLLSACPQVSSSK